MAISIPKTLKRNFGFLEDGYGLKPVSVPSDKWERTWTPSVAFANRTTGVFVEYDVRDQHLSVTIHPLKDGAFSMRGGRIAASQGYPLNSVVYLDDPHGLVGSWRDECESQPQENLSFDAYVARVAARLKLHAQDLLRGDFSRADQIARAGHRILARRQGQVSEP